MGIYVLNSTEKNHAGNAIIHSDDNKQLIYDWMENDMLIVSAINAKSVCCGDYLTWGLSTHSESFQPVWAGV